VQDVPVMRRITAVLAIALAGSLGLLGATPPVAAAAGGYRQTAATVYVLDPANGRLKVTVTLKVTNLIPDTRETYGCIAYTDGWLPIPYPSTCSRVTPSVITTSSALVENAASGLRATSDGGAATVAMGDPGAASRPVTITFAELPYGRTRTIRLSYTIRGDAPRSGGTTRAMRAFASFCTLANGADAGSVTIRLPKGYAIATRGSKLASRVSGKARLLSSGKIAKTAGWSACVTGTNGSGYHTERVVPRGGPPVSVRSWPEDPDWARSVRAGVAAGLPALERLTGRQLDGDGSITVQESATAGPYAGSYDPATRTVTIGEDVGQPGLVAHDLAHVWFNRSAVKDPWLAEGLAEWAGRAVSADAPPCTRPDATAGSLTLTKWHALAPDASQPERDAVAAQLQAACYVVAAVATAAGDRDMTAAVSALIARRDPYSADDSAKRKDRQATWRDWLDAVDELALTPAGADDTLASGLLAEYGVATDPALLAERQAARRAYHDLVSSTAGWVVPAAVRAPMAAWDFKGAMAAIEAARRAYQVTGETDAVLDGVDARHGPAAVAWARATTVAGLIAAGDLAERQLRAARDLASVRDLVGAPLDIAEQVGMFGTQVPSVDAAIPAVRAGDGDTVAATAAEIRATVTGLRATGQRRMVVGGVTALLALLVGLAVLLRRARQASMRRAEASLRAAVVAVADAHDRPSSGRAAARSGPWPRDLPDDSPTRVWDQAILTSDPDPEVAALVRRPPMAGAPPPSATPPQGGSRDSEP
jgi:hypothetical protein